MQCSRCSVDSYLDEKLLHKITTVPYKFHYGYTFMCQECDVKNNIVRSDEEYTVTTILSVYPVPCSLCNKNVYTRKIWLFFNYTLCNPCNKEFIMPRMKDDNQIVKDDYIISNKTRWTKDCDVCKIKPKDPHCEYLDKQHVIYICKECDLFYGARLWDMKNKYYLYFGDTELKFACWNCQRSSILMRSTHAYLTHLQCCQECFTKHIDLAK